MRTCMPVSQVREQFPQALHGESAHGTGHGGRGAGQEELSLSAGQGAPLYFVAVVMLRLRIRVPAPHVVEQVLQLPNGDTTQSTGQFSTTHASHATPSGM